MLDGSDRSVTRSGPSLFHSRGRTTYLSVKTLLRYQTGFTTWVTRSSPFYLRRQVASRLLYTKYLFLKDVKKIQPDLLYRTTRSQSLLLESDTHLLLVGEKTSSFEVSGIWFASCSFLNEHMEIFQDRESHIKKKEEVTFSESSTRRSRDRRSHPEPMKPANRARLNGARRTLILIGVPSENSSFQIER